MKRPLQILEEYLGKEVVVYLRDQGVCSGKLEFIERTRCFGNIILKDVAHVYGDCESKYERAVIRGSNILFIQLSKYEDKLERRNNIF